MPINLTFPRLARDIYLIKMSMEVTRSSSCIVAARTSSDLIQISLNTKLLYFAIQKKQFCNQLPPQSRDARPV